MRACCLGDVLVVNMPAQPAQGIVFSIHGLACLYTSSGVHFFIHLDHSLVGLFSAGCRSRVFAKELGDCFCGGGVGVDVLQTV